MKKAVNTKALNISRTSRTTRLAMLVALAMIFSYVESLVPIPLGIPGVKLGLANLVTVIGLAICSPLEVLAVVIMRIFLSGFMFGSGMTIIYSLSGGLLSFAVMMLLSKAEGFSVVGISVAGGVMHNVGQLIMATITVESMSVFLYVPTLLIAGVVTGILIGILSAKMLPLVRRIYIIGER